MFPPFPGCSWFVKNREMLSSNDWYFSPHDQDRASSTKAPTPKICKRAFFLLLGLQMWAREMPRMKNKRKAKIKPPKCLFWDKSMLLNTSCKDLCTKTTSQGAEQCPRLQCCEAGLGRRSWAGPRRQDQALPAATLQGTLAPWRLGAPRISHTPDPQPGNLHGHSWCPPSPLFLAVPLLYRAPSAHPTHLSPTNSNSSAVFRYHLRLWQNMTDPRHHHPPNSNPSVHLYHSYSMMCCNFCVLAFLLSCT